MVLSRAFYERDTITVAKELLGKVLVHETPEGITAGRIVETEAYRGPEDQAAHSSGGRRTARNEVMYGPKGHAYIYFIYGLYYCFNVTAGAVPGKPEAVLFRALEPVCGQELMAKRRRLAGGNGNLANGPSRLCMAMGLIKTQNQADVTVPPLFIDDAPAIAPEDVVEKPRIGVGYAPDEWKNKPWRFYIKGNRFVSKL